MKRFLSLLCFTPLGLFANNYYFSTSGNDGGSGTISSPYASLAKASSLVLNPGDSVLFKRGDVFLGKLYISRSGNSGGSIVYGSYGTGLPPVITGFVQLTSWTSMGNNRYEAYCPTCSDTVNMVQFNGNDQPMGRWPDISSANGGYRTFSTGTTTSITDSTLPVDTNWTGAQAVIRTNNFTLDRATVSSEAAFKLNFSASISGTPIAKYGYFIQGDIRTLTTPGEWYWKTSVDSLIMNFSGTSPGANQVAISSKDTLISLGANFITIDGLDLEGANKYAVAFTANFRNVIIRNSVVNDVGINGIQNTMRGGQNSFSNSKFSNINNNAISVIYPGELDTTHISTDSFVNIAIIPGMGRSGGASYSAIQLYGYLDSVILNYIYNIGGAGSAIYGGTANVWRYNYINTFGTVLCDVGGLYGSIHDHTRNTMIDNIILNGIGQHYGTTNPANIYASGIYLDNGAVNWYVARNTLCYNSYNGLFNHYTRDCICDSNTCFYNTISQWYFQEDNAADTMRGNTFLGNKYISQDSTANCVSFYVAGNADFNKVASVMDSNYYARPSRDGTTFRNNGGGLTYYTLAGWQSASGYDLHSHKSPVAISNDCCMLLFFNATAAVSSVNIPAGYVDVTGLNYSAGPYVLQPFQSLVLLKKPM